MAQRMGLIEGAFMIEPLRPTDLLYLSGQKAWAVPFGSGYRESNFGETVLPAPGKHRLERPRQQLASLGKGKRKTRRVEPTGLKPRT